MDREAAAEIFTRVLADNYIVAGFDEILDTLSDPSAGGFLAKDYVEPSRWFNALDREGQEHVKFLVREGLLSALHGVLVLADGATGAIEINDKIGALKLDVLIYNDDDEGVVGEPIETITLAPTETGMDLHDLFMSHVDEVFPATT